jgi:hypothetical protein
MNMVDRDVCWLRLYDFQLLTAASREIANIPAPTVRTGKAELRRDFLKKQQIEFLTDLPVSSRADFARRQRQCERDFR